MWALVVKHVDSHEQERLRALEEWMDDWGTLVLRLAYFFVMDRWRAEQVAEEVFVQAYRRAPRDRPTETPKVWLLRLTMTCIEGLAAVGSDQPRPGIPLDSRSGLMAQVLSLPRDLRGVLMLHYYAGLTEEEIAWVLDCAVPAVHGQLLAAREALVARNDAAFQ